MLCTGPMFFPLLLSFSLLACGVGFGAGYDFKPCAHELARLAGALQKQPNIATELFFDAQDLPEWAERQARLAYIRLYESQVVQSMAPQLQHLMDDSISAVHSELALYRTVKGRKELISRYERHLEGEDNPDERKTIELVIRVLKTNRLEESQVRQVLLQWAVEYHVRQLPISEDVENLHWFNFSGEQTRLNNLYLYPLLGRHHRRTATRPSSPEAAALFDTIKYFSLQSALPSGSYAQVDKYIDFLQALSLMQPLVVLSALRVGTFERLVDEVPRDMSLRKTPPGLALRCYEEELQSIDHDWENHFPDIPKAPRVIFDTLQSQEVFARAARLMALSSLKPFWKAEIKRHVSFLRAFSLPADTVFEHYIEGIEELHF